MAYAPRATLVVYGLPEPTVASALISAGARGVIRGGDTDLVTAVTKTVVLLGLTESVMSGVSGAERATRTDSPIPIRTDSTLAGHVGSHTPGGMNGRRDRTNGTIGPVVDRTSHPLDTRNGGPGFATRTALNGSTPLDVTPAAARGALASVGAGAGARGAAPLPSIVPQQRMDLAASGGRPPALTERELQVLRGMADGKSNAEIGRELFVSEDTVKTHARRLFRKLGARDRAHAVASGFRTGLVG